MSNKLKKRIKRMEKRMRTIEKELMITDMIALIMAQRHIEITGEEFHKVVVDAGKWVDKKLAAKEIMDQLEVEIASLDDLPPEVVDALKNVAREIVARDDEEESNEVRH